MSLTAGLVCLWVGRRPTCEGFTSPAILSVEVRAPLRLGDPVHTSVRADTPRPRPRREMARERGGGDPSKFLALRRLTAKQEGLRILSFATDLERTDIPPPEALRSLRFRLSPQLQSIEVLGCDLSLAEAVEEVVAEGGRQVGPLDLRHHSPKVMRASSSFSRFCSPGLAERTSRSV